MLDLLNNFGFDQFEYARWCEKGWEHYKIIKVSIVTESEKRWDTVLQNLITTSDSTVIRTAYAYPYDKRQHIFYRNKWWEIQSVGEKNLDVAPQSMGLVNAEISKQCVLEIVQVDGYDV